MASIFNKLFKSSEERQKIKEQKEREKTAFTKAYESEKEEVQKQRNKQRIKRAEERGKRDARNPLFKRIASKAGAIGKKGIEIAAQQIGKQARQIQKERERKEKGIRQARLSEITKAAVSAERKATRNELERRQVPDLAKGLNILGLKKEAPRGDLISMGSPDNIVSRQNNLIGGFSPLGDTSLMPKSKNEGKSTAQKILDI